MVFSKMHLRGFAYLVSKFMMLSFFFFDNIDDFTIYTMNKRTFAEKYIKGKRKIYILIISIQHLTLRPKV